MMKIEIKIGSAILLIFIVTSCFYSGASVSNSFYHISTEQMYKMMLDGIQYALVANEENNENSGEYETKDLAEFLGKITDRNDNLVSDPNEYSIFIKLSPREIEFLYGLSDEGKKKYRMDTRKIRFILDDYADSITEKEYNIVVDGNE